jgi:hypothetical protein
MTENVHMGILGVKKLSRLAGIGKSFTPNFVPPKNNSRESQLHRNRIRNKS